jgi:hypothetical protein
MGGCRNYAPENGIIELWVGASYLTIWEISSRDCSASSKVGVGRHGVLLLLVISVAHSRIPVHAFLQYRFPTTGETPYKTRSGTRDSILISHDSYVESSQGPCKI